MDSHYNLNYTKESVSTILENIKDCVRNKRYIISLNEKRGENIDFIERHELDTEEIEMILLDIDVDDFCHSLKNKKRGRENETLYVFIPRVPLREDNVEREVNIYTKFNPVSGPDGSMVIVISFHEANKPFRYLFGDKKGARS